MLQVWRRRLSCGDLALTAVFYFLASLFVSFLCSAKTNPSQKKRSVIQEKSVHFQLMCCSVGGIHNDTDKIGSQCSVVYCLNRQTCAVRVPTQDKTSNSGWADNPQASPHLTQDNAYISEHIDAFFYTFRQFANLANSGTSSL